MTDPLLSDDALGRLKEMLDEPEPTPNGVILRKLLAEIEQLRADRDDLRWLVGHLAGNCPDVGAVPLPPRLASVARECIETYQPGRFTLGVTLETADD